MSKINSRQKGKVGERQLRDVFREAGFLKCRRGQQFSGEQGNPDVVIPEIPSVHLEAKYCQNTALYDWMSQAVNDSDASTLKDRKTKIPIVCHRKKHSEWLAILRLPDLIQLLRETDRIIP